MCVPISSPANEPGNAEANLGYTLSSRHEYAAAEPHYAAAIKASPTVHERSGAGLWHGRHVRKVYS